MVGILFSSDVTMDSEVLKKMFSGYDRNVRPNFKSEYITFLTGLTATLTLADKFYLTQVIRNPRFPIYRCNVNLASTEAQQQQHNLLLGVVMRVPFKLHTNQTVRVLFS